MKLILKTLLALLPGLANAQYYFSLYNQPPVGTGIDQLTDGLLATFHPDPIEFTATGWHDYSNGPVSSERPRFVLTNKDGSAFNTVGYDIELTPGQILNARGISIAEHPNGYVVVGTVRSNPTTGALLPTEDVLIMLLDHWGGPLDVLAVNLGGDEVAEAVIYESGVFYLTGTSRMTGGAATPIFLSFKDAGGFLTLISGQSLNPYDASWGGPSATHAVGKSIAFDPATARLWIAGAIKQAIGGTFKGLLVEVDLNGVVFGQWRYTNNPLSFEYFNAIKISGSGAKLITGEAMGSPATPNQQMLVAHLQPGNDWMRTFLTPGSDGTGFDLIERKSPFTGLVSLFAAGLVNPGLTGSGDMLLYKIDPAVPGLPILSYEYGTGLTYDHIYGVAMNNSPNINDAGLALFGTSKNNGSIVRTHFDGVTTCQDAPFSPAYADHWLTSSALSFAPSNILGSVTLMATRIQYMDLVVCNSPNAGGSNLRTTGITEGQGSGEIVLFPDPANDELHIGMQVQSEDNSVEVTVFDMQGREMLSETLSPHAATINVGNLAPGIYHLKAVSGPTQLMGRFVRQ